MQWSSLLIVVVLLCVYININEAGIVTEGVGCIENHRLVNAIEIISPEYDAIITSSTYYARTAASVFNIQQFQNSNNEYSFCIKTYLYNDGTTDDVISLPLVFEECGLQVFDEHNVLGYSAKLETDNKATNQTHLFEISMYHEKEGLLCQGRRLVTCMKVEDSIPLLSTEDVQFVSSDVVKWEEFLQYISEQRLSSSTKISRQMTDNAVTVVVGIKSGALNAKLRQVIRDSWLKQAESLQIVHFVPYFLIGDSPYSENFNLAGNIEDVVSKKHENKHAETVSMDQKRVMSQFLLTEQRLKSDTLLEKELPVVDSYFTLPQKVLHFFRYLSKQKISANYVLICDDDVFIDVEELEKFVVNSAPRKQFYAGEVLEYRNKHVYKPMRDPTHANHLTPDQYPSSALPPFALGNFYLLSSDIVSYLASNSRTLKSVGTLEDLSVAVWLMSLQVFPRHLPGVCTAVMCLYDKTMFAPPVGPIGDRVLAISGLRSSEVFQCLHRHTKNRRGTGIHEWYDRYYQVVNSISQGRDCSALIESTQELVELSPSFTMKVILTPNTMYALPSVVNLLAMQTSRSPLVRVNLHCYQLNEEILTPTSHKIELELPAEKVQDIMVSGILDCGAIDATTDEAGQMRDSGGSGIAFDAVQSNAVLNRMVKMINATSVWFVSGEPTDLSALWLEPREDEQPISLTVVNTVSAPAMQVQSISAVVIVNNVYYPNFMTSVDEMSVVPREPDAPCYALASLLTRPEKDTTSFNAILFGKTLAVAYLYHRCDRGQREAFVNILNEKFDKYAETGGWNTVTALGQCNGSGLGSNQKDLIARGLQSRFSSNYLQEAIDKYLPFKFVIAFENTQVPGYISEKLTNAFFAHSIPIYWGAPDVAEYFNPKAMINCNLYENLEECAERVLDVHNNIDLYAQMLSEAPIINKDIVPEYLRNKQCM